MHTHLCRPCRLPCHLPCHHPLCQQFCLCHVPALLCCPLAASLQGAQGTHGTSPNVSSVYLTAGQNFECSIDHTQGHVLHFKAIASAKRTCPHKLFVLHFVDDLIAQENLYHCYQFDRDELNQNCFAANTTMLPTSATRTSLGTRRYLIVFPRTYVSGMRQNLSPSCNISQTQSAHAI